jgi:hypothetical protein
VELEGLGPRGPRRGGLIPVQRNKVYAVTVIAAVAEELGVDEDLLHELSIGMEPEDGVIRVLGLAEDSIIAFTGEGVDELKNLLEMNRENPDLFK